MRRARGRKRSPSSTRSGSVSPARGAAILTEYRGLKVGDLPELAPALAAAGGDYKVYKNTLVRRATADTGLEVARAAARRADRDRLRPRRRRSGREGAAGLRPDAPAARREGRPDREPAARRPASDRPRRPAVARGAARSARRVRRRADAAVRRPAAGAPPEVRLRAVGAASTSGSRRRARPKSRRPHQSARTRQPWRNPSPRQPRRNPSPKSPRPSPRRPSPKPRPSPRRPSPKPRPSPRRPSPRRPSPKPRPSRGARDGRGEPETAEPETAEPKQPRPSRRDARARSRDGAGSDPSAETSQGEPGETTRPKRPTGTRARPTPDGIRQRSTTIRRRGGNMATKEEILDGIASMTVLELSELLKEFEERFGVTAAAPVAVAAAAAGRWRGEADGRRGAGRVRRRPDRRRRQEDPGHQGGSVRSRASG